MWDKKECFEPIDRYVAERVAARFDEVSSAQKLSLMILFALFRKGHLALDFSEPERLCQLLGIDQEKAFVQAVQEGLADFPQDRQGISWVIQAGNYFYLQKNAALEEGIVSELLRLQSAKPALDVAKVHIDPRLNPEQKEAVEKGLSSPLFLLTGGPGTGKTFTATALICACIQGANESDVSVIVTAPTAKAAAHLGSKIQKELPENSSLRIGTLHRLLGRDNVVCADLIVIDESSMIDAPMFLTFLKAIPSGCRVILIGDKNQLPPVEEGSLFADLVESPKLPSVQLISSKRTSSSQLLQTATAILSGDSDAFFSAMDSAWWDLEKLGEGQFFEMLWDLCQEKFTHTLSDEEKESTSSFDLFHRGTGHVAILSCIRKGPLGVETINERFYERVLERASTSHWSLIPLVVTANHHDLELYNSDQGVLLYKKGEEAIVIFERGRVFPLEALRSYSYNYALSVHKSQGSEYDEVFVLVPQGSEVFGKEVLYTAITRAKRHVFVASTKDLIKETLSKSSRKISGISAKL